MTYVTIFQIPENYFLGDGRTLNMVGVGTFKGSIINENGKLVKVKSYKSCILQL